MSVINEVLAQLEQRGMQPAPEQTMVRAVAPQPKHNFVIPVLISGTLLLGLVAAWHALQARKPSVAAGNIARNQTVVMATTVASGVVAAPITAGDMSQAPMPPAVRASVVPSSAVLPTGTHEAAKTVQNQTERRPARHACAEPCRKDTNGAIGMPALTASATDAVKAPRKKPDPQPSVPAAPALVPVQVSVLAPAAVASPAKRISPAQQADAEYHKAVALMQQGRTNDAIEGYEAVLRLDGGHDAARRALVAMLLESKRVAEGERVLQEALQNKPERTGFAMLLARLQVERGAVELATTTLEKSLPYADAQADYQAFFAALLQRQNRHKEAITHYQIALQLAPGNGIWLMGYGISLQAVQRNEDARDAYRRALETKTLSLELQAFVQQKLRSL